MKKIIYTVVKTFVLEEEPLWRDWNDETPEEVDDEEAVFRLVDCIDTEEELIKRSKIYKYKRIILRDGKIIDKEDWRKER